MERKQRSKKNSRGAPIVGMTRGAAVRTPKARLLAFACPHIPIAPRAHGPVDDAPPVLLADPGGVAHATAELCTASMAAACARARCCSSSAQLIRTSSYLRWGSSRAWCRKATFATPAAEHCGWRCLRRGQQRSARARREPIRLRPRPQQLKPRPPPCVMRWPSPVRCWLPFVPRQRRRGPPWRFRAPLLLF